MKTYITPNTQAIEVVYGSVICHSNAGEQQQNNPQIQPGQDPNAVQKRVF